MKKLMGLLLVSAALATNPALAHGPAAAQHGGVVATAADYGFELTAAGDSAVLYVNDHGKPADSSGFSGKLTVLSSTGKQEATLTPAGDNRLQANGVALPSGAKAVATLKLPNGNSTTVRFSFQ